LAIVWLCYLPGNLECSDSMWSIPTAVSLLDRGDPNLDEYLPMLRERQFSYILSIDDHYYTIYPLGTSIMAIPAIVALRPIAAAIVRRAPGLWKRLQTSEGNVGGCPPVAEEPLIALRSWTEHVIASGIVAATAVIILMIAADELPIAAAAGLAILFAFGTSSWSSASRSLWQHGP